MIGVRRGPGTLALGTNIADGDAPRGPRRPAARITGDASLGTRTSNASRATGVSRRRTRHRAPENDRFATVAKPASSVRSASSRWAIRSLGGSEASGTFTQ